MENLKICFTGKNQLELVSEPVKALEPQQVLVQTSKTLISTGTETICYGRLFEPGTHWDGWVKYPFATGYSLVGRVTAVGNEVKHFKAGDRVAIRAAHQRYVVTTWKDLYRIPEAVSDEDATWFGLANIAQNGVRRAEHKLGDAVVVVGLGLLGQLVTQYARLLGAWQVIAIDPAQNRLAMASAHGATTTLAMTVEAAYDEVMRLTKGAGADVVYEITGVAAVFAGALRLPRRFGCLLLLGDTGNPAAQHLTPDVVLKGLRVVGAHDGNPPAVSTDYAPWTHQNMAELFFSYLSRGDMRVSDLIMHRYSPDQAAEAYNMLMERRADAMGVIFDWTQLS
jgi:2-desacetyl-2-hydroxyethyl bacteriochlorophyllide A dehydrogenase